MSRFPGLLLFALTVGACAGKSDTGQAGDEEVVVYEGDEGDECTDGGDNDRDGYFDCDDIGCWGAPDCEGQHDTGGNQDTDTDTQGDTDTDTDTETDTDTDTGGSTALAANLSSYALTYTLQWNFEDSYASIIESWGLADCTATYEGSGTQLSAADAHVTFQGTWTLTGGDCPTAQTDPASVVWYSKTSGEGYATFWFSDDMSELEDWVAHKRESDSAPIEDATTSGQWYVTDMASPFDGANASYVTEEITSIEGLIPLTLTHTMSVTFGTD